jgi:uncharacterized membrane protein YebE (DUF533 family)
MANISGKDKTNLAGNLNSILSNLITNVMKSLFSRHGGSHGGHGVHGGSGALGALGALSGHGSHGGHGGHGGHGAMGAGMAGMAGMALSSYLNERQRRKATKHAGKTGTNFWCGFFIASSNSHTPC